MCSPSQHSLVLSVDVQLAPPVAQFAQVIVMMVVVQQMVEVAVVAAVELDCKLSDLTSVASHTH